MFARATSARAKGWGFALANCPVQLAADVPGAPELGACEAGGTLELVLASTRIGSDGIAPDKGGRH